MVTHRYAAAGTNGILGACCTLLPPHSSPLKKAGSHGLTITKAPMLLKPVGISVLPARNVQIFQHLGPQSK